MDIQSLLNEDVEPTLSQYQPSPGRAVSDPQPNNRIQLAMHSSTTGQSVTPLATETSAEVTIPADQDKRPLSGYLQYLTTGGRNIQEELDEAKRAWQNHQNDHRLAHEQHSARGGEYNAEPKSQHPPPYGQSIAGQPHGHLMHLSLQALGLVEPQHTMAARDISLQSILNERNVEPMSQQPPSYQGIVDRQPDRHQPVTLSSTTQQPGIPPQQTPQLGDVQSSYTHDFTPALDEPPRLLARSALYIPSQLQGQNAQDTEPMPPQNKPSYSKFISDLQPDGHHLVTLSSPPRQLDIPPQIPQLGDDGASRKRKHDQISQSSEGGFTGSTLDTNETPERIARSASIEENKPQLDAMPIRPLPTEDKETIPSPHSQVANSSTTCQLGVPPQRSPNQAAANGLSAKEKSLSCASCDKICKSRAGLYSHLRHHSMKPIECRSRGCGRIFVDYRKCIDHEKTDHPELSMKRYHQNTPAGRLWHIEEGVPDENPELITYSASLDDPTEPNEQIPPSRCSTSPIPQESTCLDDGIKRDLEYSNVREQVNHNTKGQPEGDQLAKHPSQTLDLAATNYICPEPGCGKRSYNGSDFRRHILSHGNQKPYICHFSRCNGAYGTWGGRFYHEEHAHQGSNETPFECNFPNCKEVFNAFSKLRTHKRDHTEDRYQCDYLGCNATFGTRESYRAHHKRYHSGTS